MPNNIFSSFLDAELLNEADWNQFLNDSKNENMVEAHIAETTINVDTSIATSLQYPTIGKIENSFEIEKVSKFTFGDLKVKTMSDLTRIRIDNYLESL